MILIIIIIIKINIAITIPLHAIYWPRSPLPPPLIPPQPLILHSGSQSVNVSVASLAQLVEHVLRSVWSWVRSPQGAGIV